MSRHSCFALKLTIGLLALLPAAAFTFGSAAAQQQGGSVKNVEVTPATMEAEVGQQVTFKVVARDANGQDLNLKPMIWFASPFDLAAADRSGKISLFNPGEVTVGVVVGGKIGHARIIVKPAPVVKIDLAQVNPLTVLSTARLSAVARTAGGDPRSQVLINWASDNPSVAVVDAAGVVTAVAPGKANVKATVDSASATTPIVVMANTIRGIAVEPRISSARTGDVIHFKARVKNASGEVKEPSVRWSVSGEGALIEQDGGFVAERPGSYIVSASSGTQTAIATVVVSPRNAARELEVIGRAKIKDTQVSEEWIIGNYLYAATILDKVFTYDISDPANPKLTDTLKVDARIVNDVSTTADGKIGVITREGASSRENGIVFLDLADPAHPKVLSEYTETVTGGVHSAFVNDHYVYLTDDATGSMRVIDFKDVKAPKEVARWQFENPNVREVDEPGGPATAGRYLHDVQVKDGLAYLAYWRDGLIILDVGSGIKGGRPDKPVFVSQLRLNYNELYGNGWLAGAHAVFRYKNYVFVGDEVFPGEFDISSRLRIPVRGIVHVVDVSDINHPRKVAEYEVPEGGSHNMWVIDDVLYMGYYSGGGRVLDVSGELRGDLYRQGREIGRLFTGTPEGFRPNLPFTWGAQPDGKGLVYFNDINSGIWIVKLGKNKEKGSTSEPGS